MCLLTGLAVVCGASARAQTSDAMAVMLEWEHPFPAQVSYFKVHYAHSEAEKKNSRALEVGTPGAKGRYSWPVSVQADQSIWVAVQAIGPTGLGSPLSEWRRYEWRAGAGRLGVPGRPTLVETTSE